MADPDHLPIFFWSPPVHESWAEVPEGSVVGLTFEFQRCPIVIRAPLYVAVDVAVDALKSELADHICIGSWRWHSRELLLRLGAMRFWTSWDQDFRRQLWGEFDVLRLRENRLVKI
ncbi:MAG: hypothetical protein JKY94_01880 [Rhodobacteraceae bacterium]|nr:hypothetical protein [Paracoccaceae bacterium]